MLIPFLCMKMLVDVKQYQELVLYYYCFYPGLWLFLLVVMKHDFHLKWQLPYLKDVTIQGWGVIFKSNWNNKVNYPFDQNVWTIEIMMVVHMNIYGWNCIFSVSFSLDLELIWMLCRNLKTCRRKRVLVLGQKLQCLKRLFVSWKKWLQNVRLEIMFTISMDKNCEMFPSDAKFYFSFSFAPLKQCYSQATSSGQPGCCQKEVA